MKIRATITFLLIANNFIFSQKINDLSPSCNIKQDGLSIKFFIQDTDEKPIKKHDSNKFYFWFKAQKIVTTQGGSAGQLLDGLYQSYYSNIQLCQEGKFSSGLKNGEWKYWDKDGYLIRIEKWKKGCLSGEQLVYTNQGKLNTRIKANSFSPNTLLSDTLENYGIVTGTVTQVDEEGNVISSQHLKNGLLNGKQTKMVNGEKVTERYKKGKVIEPKTKEKPTKEEKTSKADKKDNEAKESIWLRAKKKFFTKKKKEKSSTSESENPDQKKKRKLFKRNKE